MKRRHAMLFFVGMVLFWAVSYWIDLGMPNIAGLVYHAVISTTK
jgi:hypothetical protein